MGARILFLPISRIERNSFRQKARLRRRRRPKVRTPLSSPYSDGRTDRQRTAFFLKIQTASAEKILTDLWDTDSAVRRRLT